MEKRMIPAPWLTRARRALGFGLALSLLAPPALAGVNFTSCKVYIQQKVWDKACYFCDLARKEEPENPQVYSLLALARAQRRQYCSAGGAFRLGRASAEQKKDKKRIEEVEQNQKAVHAQLYNLGLSALTRAGNVSVDDSRTSDAGTPQAKVEAERGAPADFARITENGKIHEFWYYPAAHAMLHFAPGADQPIEMPYQHFRTPPAPEAAVADTTIFPLYSGASSLAEAAYDFEIAACLDPRSTDTYRNLSFVYERLGRIDDAISAAQQGLALKPGDKNLLVNLRVAAMGRGNRLFNSGRYKEAIPAYWGAMQYDSAGSRVYFSQIAESWSRYASSEQDKAKKVAAFDSAATAFLRVFELAHPESLAERENSIYNAAVSLANSENLRRCAEVLDRGLSQFPKSKDLLGLAADVKFSLNDFAGAEAVARRAIAANPRDGRTHQILSLSLNKLGKQAESYGEYVLYKALTDGNRKTPAQLKIWVDSADNRLGPGNQCKKTLATEGYPEEVYVFSDGARRFETWFYWTKGKAVTFQEGQLHAQGAFPPILKN